MIERLFLNGESARECPVYNVEAERVFDNLSSAPIQGCFTRGRCGYDVTAAKMDPARCSGSDWRDGGVT